MEKIKKKSKISIGEEGGHEPYLKKGVDIKVFSLQFNMKFLSGRSKNIYPFICDRGFKRYLSGQLM